MKRMEKLKQEKEASNKAIEPLNLPNPNIKIYGMDRMVQPSQKSTIIEAKYLAPSEVKAVPSFPNTSAIAGVAV